MYIWRRRSYETRIYRTVFIWSALSSEVAICLTSTWPPELCPSLRSSIKFWSFWGKSFSTINCFGRGWCSYTDWQNKFQWAINMIKQASTCFQMQLSAQKQMLEWMKWGANRKEKFHEKKVSYRLFNKIPHASLSLAINFYITLLIGISYKNYNQNTYSSDRDGKKSINIKHGERGETKMI
jgi:hypothetical protein